MTIESGLEKWLEYNSSTQCKFTANKAISVGFHKAIALLEEYQTKYSASTNYLTEGIDELKRFAGMKVEVPITDEDILK